VRSAVALVLGTSTGGVGAHVAWLTEGLFGDGWPVRVCGPRQTGELFGFSRLGADFRPVQIAGVLRDPVAVIRLRRALAGSALVHAHGLRAGTVAALAGSGLGGQRRPLVVSWHNAVIATPGARRRLLAAGERFVARSATITLAASPDLASRVRELGGRDVRFAPVAAKLVAPARPPAEVRRELGVAAGRPLVVCVGRLHPQKAHDVLIRAAARWREFGPVVVIAGDGPSQGELQDLITRELAPVRLLGRREDVADLLGAADLVVLASRWEARSLAAQESMAAGRALVTTAVGGTAALVGDGAVLVAADDVDGLDAAVRGLLADPARRAELGARARRQAASWPTPDDTLAQVEAVYRELLGEPG
jgi:glycosyltransferase involved in cell wall biosynthesis